MPRPIFLLTDFGLADPFVGIMKGVVLRLSPGSPIVDLTHDSAPQDIVGAAAVLEDSLPWLPADAVVCAVVDPGVGSARRALAVECDGRWLVGPDNGVLEPAVRGQQRRVFALRPGSEVRPDASATFHGRDVFAPAAAMLAAGADPAALGDPAADESLVAAPMPEPAPLPGGGVRLVVLRADRFGNLPLNLRRGDLARWLPGVAGADLVLAAGGREIRGLKRTYADSPPDEPLFYWNSAERLEIAVRGASASAVLGLGPGSPVELRAPAGRGAAPR